MPQMNRQRGEEPGSEAGRGYAYDLRALNWFSCSYILPNYLYSRPPRRFTCLVPSWDKHVVVDCSCFLCRSDSNSFREWLSRQARQARRPKAREADGYPG